MKTRQYTIIVPAIDRTGPVNVAFDLGRAAAEAGYEVRVLWLTAKGSRTDSGFAREVRQFKVSDLWKLKGWVHTHCMRPDFLGGLLSLNRRVTTMTTLHNLFLLDLEFDHRASYVRIAWWIWRRAIVRFDHVVCISNAMRRYYRRHLGGRRLELVYNFRAPAVSATLEAPIVEWMDAQRAAGRCILCFCGSLSARKNVDGLIGALPHAPDVAVLLCGDGPERQRLEYLSKELGTNGRVLFTGHLDVPSAAIARADALVLPSFAEGFPLVVLEAASVGVPSLLSNIAVHRELAKIGFGRTFDHHRFDNFIAILGAIQAQGVPPRGDLTDLWASGYSPQLGFASYESLVKRIS
ncbi:MAG: glycosyltransferase family 4 protein [Burkholderiaceae bacterium]